MAISSVLSRKSLVLKFDAGVFNGKQTFKTKSFSKINETATDEQMYSTAMALADLQEFDLHEINKIDLSRLRNY